MLHTNADYQVPLLRLMAEMPNDVAAGRDATAAFGRRYNDLITSEAYGLRSDNRTIIWEHKVAWARFELVQRGLMDAPGRGVWRITPLGHLWLADHPGATHLNVAEQENDNSDSPASTEQRDEASDTDARDVLRQMGLIVQQVGTDITAASQPVVTNLPPTVDERDEFFSGVSERVQSYLRQKGIDGFQPDITPRSHSFQLRMDAFPGSHYEVAIHRGTYEIGLHFESSQTQSLRRLATFQPHVDQLSELLGEPVVAEVWREQWGRVFVEYPLHELAWKDFGRFGVRVGRFVELTYPILRDAYAEGTKGRGRSVVSQEIHAILDTEVDTIRQFLLGRRERPTDERLCDWVHFCYTFALYNEVTQLFRLIDPAQVNAWHYERAKRLAKICAIRT